MNHVLRILTALVFGFIIGCSDDEPEKLKLPEPVKKASPIVKPTPEPAIPEPQVTETPIPEEPNAPLFEDNSGGVLKILADSELKEEVSETPKELTEHQIFMNNLIVWRSYIKRGVLEICPYSDWSKVSCRAYSADGCLDLEIHAGFSPCARQMASQIHPHILECRPLDWSKTQGLYEMRCLVPDGNQP